MACGVSQSTKSRFRAGGGLGHRTQGPRGSCRLAEGPSRVEGGLLRRARTRVRAASTLTARAGDPGTVSLPATVSRSWVGSQRQGEMVLPPWVSRNPTSLS